MRCKTCHYSLANLTGPPHRCPECGTRFDPNDPSTFQAHAPSQPYTLRRAVLSIASIYIIVVAGVLIFLRRDQQLVPFFTALGIGLLLTVPFALLVLVPLLLQRRRHR